MSDSNSSTKNADDDEDRTPATTIAEGESRGAISSNRPLVPEGKVAVWEEKTQQIVVVDKEDVNPKVWSSTVTSVIVSIQSHQLVHALLSYKSNFN